MVEAPKCDAGPVNGLGVRAFEPTRHACQANRGCPRGGWSTPGPDAFHVAGWTHCRGGKPRDRRAKRTTLELGLAWLAISRGRSDGSEDTLLMPTTLLPGTRVTFQITVSVDACARRSPGDMKDRSTEPASSAVRMAKAAGSSIAEHTFTHVVSPFEGAVSVVLSGMTIRRALMPPGGTDGAVAIPRPAAYTAVVRRRADPEDPCTRRSWPVA